MKRQQRFIKLVSRRMDKAGFECSIQDNQFFITKDGKPFEVKIGDAPGWGNHRVHFNLCFAFEDMDKVQQQGLTWLVSECNNHSDYAITRFWDDHFSCCMETTVRSAKDFVREFCFAYKQIGITFQNLSANYANIMEQYWMQPERRPIGFLADRYMSEKEKSEACKLVAQTNNTFANENKTERL